MLKRKKEKRTLCTSLYEFSPASIGRYNILVVSVKKNVHHAYILLSDEKKGTVIVGFFPSRENASTENIWGDFHNRTYTKDVRTSTEFSASL